MTDQSEGGDRLSSWASARRILCVRLDTIGDVLMTSPAIRALKQSSSGGAVTLLTSSAGAEIGRLMPEVDDVIVYDAPWMKPAPRDDALAVDILIARLRAEEFDAAVIFTVFSQNPLASAYLCYLANIPLRLGHARENPYHLLSHWVPEIEPERFIRHEVRRQLDLVATVGARTDDQRLSVGISQRARAVARDRLRHAGVDLTGPWAIIHAGSTAESRRYPPEGFAEVARRLSTDDRWQMVFTGSVDERPMVADIRRQMGVPSFNLAGRLTLEELAATIELAPVLITNNTGPSHLAAAVGTPVVVLYALTNPQHTPWHVPSRVLSYDVPCKYCYRSICPEGHHHCLRMVSPDQVIEAARELVVNPGALSSAESRGVVPEHVDTGL